MGELRMLRTTLAILSFTCGIALGQGTTLSGARAVIERVLGGQKPQHVPGFPVLIPNDSGSAFGNNITYPDVADLDGDGEQEIVVGRSDGTLFALDSSGHALPGFPVHLGPSSGPLVDCIDQEPALADMDGDGDLEIVVGVDLGTKSRLWVLDHDGSPHPLWPQNGVSLGGALFFSPAAVDLDGDGHLDIIMGGYSEAAGARLFVLDRTGQSLPGFPKSFSGFPLATAAAADILGGPLPELIFLGGDFQVHVLGSTGQELPGWPIPFNGFRSVPAIGDLDGDGVKEIILGEDNVLGAASGRVYVFEPDGSVRAGWPQATENPSTSFPNGSPSLADLDGDGTLEILAAASDPLTPKTGSLYVWHESGARMSGWPEPVYRPASTGTNVTVGDVDADGVLEIATLSHFDVQELALFRPDGTMKPGFPCPLDDANNSMSTPVIADLNGDGDFEIVFTWFFNSCLECPPDTYFGAIDAIQMKSWLPTTSEPAKPWGQFKQNPRHTGEHP